MELHHSFTVRAPLADTWEAFGDLAEVAGCFPGAAVTSHEGDEFEGTCKVKLGPIALVYTGAGSFLERDEPAGRFVIEARGKDKRGNGTASARVTTTMAAQGSGTRVDVATDLQITGKPAQFGRGVIQEVSDKLLQQFVVCLASKVEAGPASDGPASDGPIDDGSGLEPQPVPTADGDALDLGATVLPVLLRSYWKQALALGVTLVLLWRWLRR